MRIKMEPAALTLAFKLYKTKHGKLGKWLLTLAHAMNWIFSFHVKYDSASDNTGLRLIFVTRTQTSPACRNFLRQVLKPASCDDWTLNASLNPLLSFIEGKSFEVVFANDFRVIRD